MKHQIFDSEHANNILCIDEERSPTGLYLDLSHPEGETVAVVKIDFHNNAVQLFVYPKKDLPHANDDYIYQDDPEVAYVITTDWRNYRRNNVGETPHARN